MGPDVLRFIFTSKGDGSTTISNDPLSTHDLDGVETARIMGDARMGVGPMWTNTYMPKRALDVIRRNDNLPQFRITHTADIEEEGGVHSDFQVSKNGNLHIKPVNQNTKRTMAVGFLDGELNLTNGISTLDVAGRVRVRELPDTKPSTLIMGYQLADINEDNPEDYILGRIDLQKDPCLVLNSLGDWTDICALELDCRWTDIASTTVAAEEDMFVGNNPNEECYRGKVGIGTNNPNKAKLNVRNIFPRDSVLIGIYGRSQAFILDYNDYIIGVSGRGDTGGLCCSHGVNVGVQGTGFDSRYTLGVNGVAYSHPVQTGGVAIGVRGVAYGNIANDNVGVYGEVIGTGSLNPGYFVGGNVVLVGGSPIVISDESVKNTIEDVVEATTILTALQPKTYYFQSPENRTIAFDEDLQYGFIAQEVEEILPDIVRKTTVPELLDSLGVIEGTSVDLLGIKYDALIPILVAGFKEQQTVIASQQAMINAQNETIDALQDQLAEQAQKIADLQENMTQVMSSFQQTKSQVNICCGTGGLQEPQAPGSTTKEGVTLEQNVPNPFSNETLIAFELEKPATVRLDITDSAGRLLETVIEERMESGAHQIRWDGSRYPSGVYYYSLYADTVLLTKKMIKQ